MCSKICLCVFTMRICSAIVDRRHINRFTIESRGDFTDTLLEGFSTLNFSPLYQITSSVWIFEYKGNRNAKYATELVINAFQEQIQAIEPTRIYNDSMKPAHTSSDGNESIVNMTNFVCSHYYGMDVQKVWERNITGKGVTIAVTDVGIDTNLKDLEPNINKELCKNFLTNTSDVSPDYYAELMDKPPIYSTHGNFVASVTASIKNNKFCSAGIAHGATLVGLKIYNVTYDGKNVIGLSTDAEILARSLKYALDKIDIFVNAWRTKQPFDQLDLATKAAIKHGATKGRRGLGTIYVVPAGPVGNVLSSNIHTITVNSIGRFGEKPAGAVPDASVLVSGLNDGHNLTAKSMVTTSHDDKHVRTFRGVSVAVAQVSGVIALGLQTNRNLTLRDIQHLLVQSAEYTGLDDTYAFHRNGAGRYYHRYFGFGLINATKLVLLAKTRQAATERLEVKLEQMTKKISEDGHLHEYKFCHSCTEVNKQTCLTVIEHVSISLEFKTYTRQLEMHLTSPSGTRSLFEIKRDTKGLNKTTSGQLISVNFWDELAFGEWTFTLSSLSLRGRSQTNLITRISMKLYGTNRILKNFKSQSCDVMVENKDSQTILTKQKDKLPDFKAVVAVLAAMYFVAVVVMFQCKKIYSVTDLSGKHVQL